MTAIQERLKKMETFFDQKEFVVIDHGTGFIKAGFSGEDLPRCVIPTVVGTHQVQIDPNQQPTLGQGLPQDGGQQKIDYAYGNAAFAQKATHQLHYPIRRGVIEDFQHMENLWEYIFEHELNLDPKNMNVLLTDAPLNTKENKQEIAQIMFETFKVESLAIMNTAVLSLFSTGKTTGIVAECGEGVSYTVPVFEGYALPHAIHNLEIAGQDVTNELIRQFKADNVPLNENHFEYVREMKEQMCSVALNYESAIHSRDPLNEEQRSYELPDDKGIIQVDHHKRFRATEAIFNPNIIGSDEGGLATIAYKAIEKCDADLKINLYNNVVLAGGSTLMPGFHERFDYELKNLAMHSTKTDINVYADLHRKYAAWIGGSMIASFSTFSDMTIKRDEYENIQDGERSHLILKKTIY